MLAATGIARLQTPAETAEFLAGDSPEGLLRRHAGWLVRLWRLSPLTLLLHSSDTQVEHLLAQGVLRLTARRAIDRAWRHTPGPAARALTPGASAILTAGPRTPEQVLQVDATLGHDPLRRLQRKLQALLPATAPERRAPASGLCELAHALHRQGGRQLLIVVRQLERLLAPRNDDPAARQAWCDALVELLAHGPPSVHLLVVVDERADLLLGGLRRRLPLWDDHRLRVGQGSTPIEPAASPVAPASAQDFQRALDAMLLRVAHYEAPARRLAPADASRLEPLATAGAEVGVGSGAGAEADRVAVPESMPAPKSTPASATSSRPDALPLPRQQRSAAAWAALSLVGLLAAGLAWVRLDTSPQPVILAQPTPTAAPIADTAAAPAAAPSPAPPPSAGEELAQSLAATGLPLADPGSDAAWAPALRAVLSAPGLAVLRYDSLQAARGWPEPPALQVLAPLYTEAVAFFVREDSPWQFLHQIQGARLNLGPADGARALAVQAAWQGLFGQPPAAAQADTQPASEGLASLRAGRLDVVAWVGSLPAGALPDGGAGLRPLSPDPAHPSTARLRQRFLLTLPSAGSGGGMGLATMNFLVGGAGLPPDAQRAVARSLCAALPELRASGQPAWQAVQPVPVLPSGWPAAAAAVDEFNRCAAAGLPPARRVSSLIPADRRPS